ncbi:MAG: hypothetical protein JST40_04870 [Armatimonadetes bacterium]|nr:hypothetical protein [Armatimonadota bacterium]
MARVNRIHFVCRNNLNVTELQNGEFESGFWKVSYDVANSVKEIYLHNSRSDISYRQGEILGFRLFEHDGSQRYIFRLRPLAEPRKWFGGGAQEKSYDPGP